MFLLYDPTSDTLQTRTRRYERDRESYFLVVPDWPNVVTDGGTVVPHWMADTAMQSVIDDVFTYIDGDAENGPRHGVNVSDADMQDEATERLHSMLDAS